MPNLLGVRQNAGRRARKRTRTRAPRAHFAAAVLLLRRLAQAEARLAALFGFLTLLLRAAGSFATLLRECSICRKVRSKGAVVNVCVRTRSRLSMHAGVHTWRAGTARHLRANRGCFLPWRMVEYTICSIRAVARSHVIVTHGLARALRKPGAGWRHIADACDGDRVAAACRHS